MNLMAAPTVKIFPFLQGRESEDQVRCVRTSRLPPLQRGQRRGGGRRRSKTKAGMLGNPVGWMSQLLAEARLGRTL